jgi:hypothetical protein
MSKKREIQVRLDRQAHRHAVLRLRQAYQKLWQSQQPERSKSKNEVKLAQVQEVLECQR